MRSDTPPVGQAISEAVWQSDRQRGDVLTPDGRSPTVRWWRPDWWEFQQEA